MFPVNYVFPGNLICIKGFGFFIFFLLGHQVFDQVLTRIEEFVDFTLYYNGYYDFIGKK